MGYKPESRTDDQVSHDCPQDCARMVDEMYVNCDDIALTEEQITEARFCSPDRHRWQVLPQEVDGNMVSRCFICGCWKW